MHNIAFVVGVQKYGDPNFEELPCVNFDIHSMETTLFSNCACAQNEIFTYLDVFDSGNLIHPASLIREIRKKGEQFSSQNIDTLFFYYSGHGFLANEKPQICFSETDYATNTGALAIDILEITLSDLRIAKHIVIILDTCQSPLISKGIDDVKVKSPNSDGVIIFYSCSPRQSSYALENGSIFTKLLVEILSDTNSYFTVDEISSALKEKTENFRKENNYKIDFQNPRTSAFDLSLGKVELKQRNSANTVRSNTTASVNAGQKTVPLILWPHHKERIYKVYFSANIHSSDKTLNLMKNVVLREGDLPIFYDVGSGDINSLAGIIDDSDFAVILLDSSLNSTELESVHTKLHLQS